MSSHSGSNNLNKGDKRKYQSLDINKYQGKGVEAQKSTVQRQHGLQSLGKVTNHRRMPPPINLPSLKSENSGNDPTVNLVPSGPASTGWGSGKTATSTESQQQSGQQSRQQQNSTLSSGTSRSVTGTSAREMGMSTAGGLGSSGGSGVGTASHTLASGASATAKTWSSVTGKGKNVMFDQEKPVPPPSGGGKESGRFTRDFPSLDGAAQTSGSGGKPGANTQLDLRPQNVGSWREGGGKNITSDPLTVADTAGGGGPSSRPTDIRRDIDDGDRENFRSSATTSSYNGRMYNQKSANSSSDAKGGEGELFKRPTIVKERDIEELGHKAANRAKNDDSSWATASGEIDYSVKLIFSDDEDASGGSRPSGRDSRPKRSTPPDSVSKPTDRGRTERLADRSNESEQRSASSGAGYDRDRPGGSREAWAPHPYPPYHAPPPQAMMHQQRMQFDMWQRANQQSGGKMPPPPNMPPNMHPGPYDYRMQNRPQKQISGEDEEDDMWRGKQQQTKVNVNVAVERAKSKRGEESEESRRSRSASESSSSDQTQSQQRSGRYGNNNRKSQNQVPPRFQQQKSVDKTSERGSSGGSRDDENKPPYHPPAGGQSGVGGGQQPPHWGMGWPMHPPHMPWMAGMPPPPPMPPTRQGNSNRGSDDERRTPDQNYPPPQFYEYQMRHWMHMVQELSKANPDFVMPPSFVIPPRGTGPPIPVPPHPQPPPQYALGADRTNRDKVSTSDSERDREKDSTEHSTKQTDGKVSAEESHEAGKISPASKVQSDPFAESAAPDSSAITSSKVEGTSKAPSSSSAGDRRQSAKEDTSISSRQNNRSSTSSRTDRRDEKKGPRDEKKGPRSDERSSTKSSRYSDQDGGYRATRTSKYRDEPDNRDISSSEAGRKRRSEISAPVPVVKETLRADPDRQRQMVTLKRSNKGGSSSSVSGSGGGGREEGKVTVTRLSNSAASGGSASDKPHQRADPAKSSSAADSKNVAAAPPKPSAWGPTPAPQAAPIGTEDAEAKAAAASKASEIKAVTSVGNYFIGERQDERSKVSPAYSDSDKPLPKRPKEEREYNGGGGGGRYDRPNSRGGRSEYLSERGSRRGGAKGREFVRSGSAATGRGGPTAGASGRGSRSVSSRGAGRGRGSYDRFGSRDFRENYTPEDWEVEKMTHIKKDSKPSNAASTDSVKQDRGSKEPQRQSSTEGTSGSTPSVTTTAKVTSTNDVVKSGSSPVVVGEAPPPQENIWDKRKQELNMRDTPSPTLPAGRAGAPVIRAISVDLTTAEQTAEQKSKDGGEEATDRGAADDKHAARRDDGRRAAGSRGGRERPTRGTYVAPGSRPGGGPSNYGRRQQPRNEYYDGGYEYGYDDGSGGYGRGSGRNRGSSRGRGGFQSSRGRPQDSRGGASRTNSRDEGTDKGPTIDQWNGPPEDSSAGGIKSKSERWEGDDQDSSHYSQRGRGRGRGGRYATRGGSSMRGGRTRHPILPSAPHSPGKRRQDSTNTDNDPQEEWETASESSDHLKDSAAAAQSSSRSNRHSDKSEDVSGAPPQPRSNGSTTYRGPSSRPYRGSGERGRGRGGSRGSSTRGGFRGNSVRDGGRYDKERATGEQNTNSSASSRGGRPNHSVPNAKSGGSAVYRVDEVSLDNPAAIAAAMSNKNSELSDVSKPLSNKERAANTKHNHSSSTKEQVSAPVADPLDGFDLNNYAGVVIIDEMGGHGDDSDGWQDEDGFQEVKSKRKTRKEKLKQELAAQAAKEAKIKAAELIAKKERSQANANRKVGSAHRSQSPRGRKAKLPPRFMKQHQEEKAKQDRFKIEQWNNSMIGDGSSGKMHSSSSSSRPVSSSANNMPETPVQIGSWDQHMAAAAVSAARTTAPTVVTTTTNTVTGSLVMASTSSVSTVHTGTASDGKPAGDKNSASEQHDSGIDVGNDKDTGSVRSSPDAGSVVQSQMRQGLMGQTQHTHFSAPLPLPQHDSKTPMVNRTAVSSLSSGAGGMKLDFTFDPELARMAELKEQNSGAGSVAAVAKLNRVPSAASNEASADLNMKLDSVKTLWDPPTPIPTPQNTNTSQSSSLFGAQSKETGAFQKSATEGYEQVEMTPSSDTYSASSDGFLASRSEGFQDKTVYHSTTNNSQSASNVFVSPGAETNSAAIGSSRQPQSPRTNQLISPRTATVSSGDVVSTSLEGVSTASSSSQSTLDGGASVFTPSFNSFRRHPPQSPSAASHPSAATMLSQQVSQGYNFMSNMVPSQPSQLNVTDNTYQSYRNQTQSAAQQPGLPQSVQQSNLAQVGLQQAVLQQATYQQNNMVASSQPYPPAMMVSTPSIMSSMVKPNTVVTPGLAANFQTAKLGQFDTSSMPTTTAQPLHQQQQQQQQQMQYVPAFDLQSIMVSQAGATGQQTAAYRLTAAQTQAQLGQQPQSAFYGAPTQTQNPIGYFATSPSPLQGSTQSPFTIGLVQPAQGTTLVPQGSMVLGQQPTAASAWAQPSAASQQQLKQYKSGAGVSVGNPMGSQLKVQLSNHQAAVMSSQQPFQISGAGSTFSAGQPAAAGADFAIGLAAAQHMQTAAGPPTKWGNSSSPQTDKAHMGGVSQLGTNQVPGSKMGGANMMGTTNQMQVSMQKNLKPGFQTAGPAGPPRPGFNPRMGMPPPLMHSLVSAPTQQSRRHPSPQPAGPRTQYAGPAMGRGATHPSGAHTARFPPPIQRPAQNRQGGRSSKTPPTNPTNQSMSKSSGPSGNSQYASMEERRKMREAAINVAKNFLNPDNKPKLSQQQQQTPGSSASAAPLAKSAGAASDTFPQVSSPPISKSGENPTVSTAAAPSSTSTPSSTITPSTEPSAAGDQ